MIICVVVYVILLVIVRKNKQGKLPNILEKREWNRVLLVLFLSATVSLFIFLLNLSEKSGLIRRNDYGEGNKTETYQVSVEGELEEGTITIEVGEQEYSQEEIQEIFQNVMEELDTTILGDNESKDRIEYDLNLMTTLEGYPIEIEWEINPYHVLSDRGEILETYKETEGTLVEIRGKLFYRDNEAVYVTHVMVYPEKKVGREKWLSEIEEAVAQKEAASRQKDSFALPEIVGGKEVRWSKKADLRGYYILVLGIVVAVLLAAKKLQDEKDLEKQRQEQLLRDYPELLNKVMLLLSTGATMKNVWFRIVENYEAQKEPGKTRIVYQEMKVTCFEMQSGIPEAEAYERFGARLKLSQYMKFGALLSQNLRKGSKGLVELLRVESIQAFENRKSMAKRSGEEASTKLLLPMFGMLAVVLIIVVIPAFLSIQL